MLRNMFTQNATRTNSLSSHSKATSTDRSMEFDDNTSDTTNPREGHFSLFNSSPINNYARIFFNERKRGDFERDFDYAIQKSQFFANKITQFYTKAFEYFNLSAEEWELAKDWSINREKPGYPRDRHYVIRINGQRIEPAVEKFVQYVLNEGKNSIKNFENYGEIKGVHFPNGFLDEVKVLTKRLVRLFIIVYSNKYLTKLLCEIYFDFEEIFEELLFFIWEHNLVGARELNCLDQIKERRKDFENQKIEYQEYEKKNTLCRDEMDSVVASRGL
eukprot:maker-scaffold_19-snap-gene-2.45-mRNA-1 protein AED:0.00 eAED:0.00 QI:29/1/1/1/1/1/2/486/273